MSDHKFILTRWMAKFTAYGRMYEARPDHPKFEYIKQLLRSGSFRKAVTAYNAGRRAEATAGFVTKDNVVKYRGHQLPPIFAEIYKETLSSGVRLPYLEQFFDNYYANPRPPSLEDLARFMEKNRLPITSRGTFLAYKSLRSDYTDIHTGRFDNHPGRMVAMERDRVDHNYNNQCSNGLHVCAYAYISGGRYSVSDFERGTKVVVEVNPRDVCAVPNDLHCAKMRVNRYLVLAALQDFGASELGTMNVLGRTTFYNLDRLKAVFRRPGAIQPVAPLKVGP